MGVLAADLHCRVQPLVGPCEALARPEQQSLHGRLRCFQHLRNLLVAATFHFAEEQREMLTGGYRGERLPREADSLRL